jgi:hypothetical protein
MGNPFVFELFSSGSAEKIWELTHGLYKGGKWVPTPLTDPKIKESLADWWRKSFEALSKVLDPAAAQKLETAKKNVIEMLGNLNNPGVSKEDVGQAVIGTLATLEKALPNVENLMKDPKTKDTVAEFVNASFSVAKNMVVVVESSLRSVNRKEPFNETFNEIMARDCAATVYELTGDPPRELYIHSGDTAKGYLDVTSAHMTPDSVAGLRQLAGYIDAFTKAGDKAQQQSAMIGMARWLQEVGTNARSLAEAMIDDRGGVTAYKAGVAAVQAELASEAMRAIFGMDRRGGTGQTVLNQAEESKRTARGREAANELRGRLEKEREERRDRVIV